jgi:hypothetical protein
LRELHCSVALANEDLDQPLKKKKEKWRVLYGTCNNFTELFDAGKDLVPEFAVRGNLAVDRTNPNVALVDSKALRGFLHLRVDPGMFLDQRIARTSPHPYIPMIQAICVCMN